MKVFSSYMITIEHQGLTVEQYLKLVLHCSGRKLQKLTRQKGLRLNNKPVFLQRKLKPGDCLQIAITEDTHCGIRPEQGPIEILYEDNYLLVLNKPPRQLVHPAGQTTGGTLANFLAFQLQQRGMSGIVRAVHRIDRDTSGCVLFAKDAHSQSVLTQQLAAKLVKRTYWALVKGSDLPLSGTIDAPIGPHPTLANRRAIHANGEPAVTHFRLLRSFSDASLLELSLETGRTHQIRVHLAHLGHPIIGDGMYGVRTSWMPRQALHAASISFRKIKQAEELTVHAPLPADFASAIEYCASSPVSS